MLRCALVLGRSLIQMYELEEPEISIGRDEEQDIRIDNDSVSRRHATLRQQGNGWVLQDLGTANGTRLNAKPVDFAPLKSGDTIQFGKHTIIFDPSPSQVRRLERGRGSLGRAAGGGGAGTLFMETGDLETVMRSAQQEQAAHVVMTLPDGEEKRFELPKEETLIGKAVAADIVIRGFLIGAFHALIRRDRHGFKVVSLRWTRAVRINGRAVREARLMNRDEIRIGPNVFKFYDEL